MKTLAQLRNHPAVEEIIQESDFGYRTYVINLKAGFATDNGGGQQSGTESTLAGVAAFLRSVAPMPVEIESPVENVNLAAARVYVAKENDFAAGNVNLKELIETFNELSPAARAYLSQAHAEAKAAWLGSIRRQII
jgi:hypothetical protein